MFVAGNACGLYSLIHAVGNGSSRDFVIEDSLIDKLLKEAIPLKRAERADVLYNSKELEAAHMASAVHGDSRIPSAAEPVGYHFITFTKGKDGHLWEVCSCSTLKLPCCYCTDSCAARGRLESDRSWRAQGVRGHAK